MQDYLGYTALGAACQEGHIEVGRLLIEKGGTVDYQNKVRLLLQCSMCIITVALIEWCTQFRTRECVMHLL